MQVLPYGGTFDPDAAQAAQRAGQEKWLALVPTPAGMMALVQRGEALDALRFAPDVLPGEIVLQTPLLREGAAQLAAYFEGNLRRFELPLAPLGTPFQTLIWHTLAATVPYGQTVSYGELARRAGKPAASRAVGMANHHNPLPIFIPCHRVIGANGALVGYGGGLPLKERLLRLEQAI